MKGGLNHVMDVERRQLVDSMNSRVYSEGSLL